MKKTLVLFTSLALAAPAFIGASVADAQVPDLQAGPGMLLQRADAFFRGADRDRHPDDDGRDHGRDWGRGGSGGDWGDPRDPRFGEQPVQAPFVQRRARPTPVRRIGQVASLIRGLGRSVRGLHLSDGSVVMLRRDDMFLAQRVQPGSFVRIRGVTRPESPTTILRATVSPLRRMPRGHAAQPMPPAGPETMQPPSYAPPATPVYAPPPAPVYAPPAPAPTFPQLSSAQGTIRSILGDAHGLPQTLILTDGSRIAIPTALAQAIGHRGLRTGETISFWAQRAHENGRLVATALQLSDGSILRSAMPGVAGIGQ